MASDVRIKLLLECQECKRRNYTTNKNRRNTQAKLGAAQILPLGPQTHLSPRS